MSRGGCVEGGADGGPGLVRGGWPGGGMDGVTGGARALNGCGADNIALLRAGQVFACDETASDARTRAFANAYAKVGIETGVISASPHKLIVMLFDGALVSVTAAIMHMKAGDIPAKGAAISKAIMIMDI